MVDLKAKFRTNLRSFFDQQISFFADKEWQYCEWVNAYGDSFGIKVHLYHCAWKDIHDNQKDSTIPNRYYKMTEKLYDIIWEFQLTNDHPTKPQEYRTLMYSPGWKKIQRYAKELYDTVRPNI